MSLRQRTSLVSASRFVTPHLQLVRRPLSEIAVIFVGVVGPLAVCAFIAAGKLAPTAGTSLVAGSTLLAVYLLLRS